MAVPARFRLIMLAAVTASLKALARHLEHQSLSAAEVPLFLAFVAFLGTAALPFVAIRGFKSFGVFDILVGSCCVAALPFLTEHFLNANGLKFNIHGIGSVAYLLNWLVSLLCAVGLLVGLAVRLAIRLRTR